MTSTWKTHLPMYITYGRMAGAPFIILLMYVDRSWGPAWAAVLFVLLSITDWLDGYLARRYHCESAMGKFMDPIADKILVLAALLMLLKWDAADPIMVFLLLTRDIFIGGLRSVAAANNVIIAAKPFGKWKTAIQMISIPAALIESHKELSFDWSYHPVWVAGYIGLWVSVILSMISAAEYSYGYYKGRLA